ncbi:MAG: bifunctional 5,10-methylenetetrahydrofolate dehydrogenase/5,10-methenyltetrahydrofolate cyclohydrolase [Clostridiales bacterium]|nr:bifunctional 5,10-methylenetetrahydrofolate dehydrogenase/5,10-methenyltetrahydrofolate cyclohydrolase [Clostridiales bacterium]
MAKVLKGKPVADRINEESIAQVEKLREKGIQPTLAILRVGARADDISYERGAMKRCDAVGVAVKNVVLSEDISQEVLMEELDKLNRDSKVHGILVFRPLPKHMDGEAVRLAMNPAKDVDGITDGSLSGVFTNMSVGFCPCTAQAAVEILDYYGIACSGKRAAVIGRSLVVGRPAAMLLMHKNATVTICHTRTEDMPSVTKEADIIIVCAGKMEAIDAKYFRSGQTVIDVGIGFNETKGKLCGDVDYDAVEPVVDAITPVPGGVGSVTTAVLVKHVVEAAGRAAR